MVLRVATAAIVIAALASSALASHDVETRLSAGGLDYIGQELPARVPESLELAPLTTTLYSCQDGDARLTQRDTTIAIDVSSAQLEQVEPGVLRVALTFSLAADGELYFEKPFFCSGEMECGVVVGAEDVQATVDLAAGGAGLEVVYADLDLQPDDLTLEVSGCAIATLANEVVELTEGLIIDALAGAVERYAEENLGALLIGALAGVTTHDLGVGPLSLTTSLDSIDVFDGISARGYIDIQGPPPAACFVDPGEPEPQPGLPTTSDEYHASLAMNLGLIDDVLYHAWATASACEGRLADASLVGAYLPDVAADDWSLRIKLLEPPAVAATGAGSFQLVVDVPSIEAELGAARAGETDVVTARMRARAHLSATTRASSLVFEVRELEVLDVVLDDEASVSESGFDATRIAQLLADHYLPSRLLPILEGELSVPIGFGGGGFHAILRALHTEPGYLIAGADLFAEPLDDDTAPDTVIDSAPAEWASPASSIVLASAADAEVPAELLRFRVSVDGIVVDEAGTGWVRVGVPGVTDEYLVEVAAIDLAGNVDPSPATATVRVDGIRPSLSVERRGSSVRFVASDDLSPTSALRARVDIVRLRDGWPEPVESRELAPGATSAELGNLPAGRYRVTVVAADEAGNEGAGSVILTVGGGCAAGGGAEPPPVPSVLVLFLAGLSLVRRRWRSLGDSSGGG